ncbi:MAG: RAD55 family ATPase [Candidatus Nezhaarchaeales archaeon]
MDKPKVELIRTGVKLLDSLAPEGLPKNSLVILSGESGTGKSVLLLQVVKEALKTDKPVVFVCFDDAPFSIEYIGESTGSDIKSYAEKGTLHFIDCYSFRMSPDPSKMPPHVTYVENPKNLHDVTNAISAVVDKFKIEGRGLLVIDSITELFSLDEPLKVIESIKKWRAEYVKKRNILSLASVHLGLRILEQFYELLEYVADVIIDFRYEPSLLSLGYLLKQLRIRKLKGAPHELSWAAFTVTKDGVTPLDLNKLAKKLKIPLKEVGEFEEE